MQQDDRSTPFTHEQIRQFDGKGDKPTYIALNGFVFDVSSSHSFKEGGTYSNFPGRDITMAAAFYQTDDEYVNMTFDE